MIIEWSTVLAGHAGRGKEDKIRFSTLTRLCEALDCQPGDLLSHHSSGSQAG